MQWGIEAYERLKWAQQNRPDPSDLAKLEAERKRADERSKIMRRLPKVA